MKQVDFEALKSLVVENRDKRVLLTFHSIGDTDSVASALALSRYFRNPTVAMPDVVSSNAIRVMHKLGINTNAIRTDFDDRADLVVLLDVNNFEDCGGFRRRLEGFRGPILIIDHHAPKEIARDDVVVFNNETYNSASSIVCSLMESLGFQVDAQTAQLLLVGIISDSAELKNSTADTFMQMGRLLKYAHVDYSDVLQEMMHISDPEARARTMGDLQGASTEIFDGLLFVWGKAHSHANIAADIAINAGADLAFFYAENGSEVSFSARLRPPLDKRFGIHLGVIMRTIAPLVGCTGGGHPCAAGAYGRVNGSPEDFTDRFREQIAKRMGGRSAGR